MPKIEKNNKKKVVDTKVKKENKPKSSSSTKKETKQKKEVTVKKEVKPKVTTPKIENKKNSNVEIKKEVIEPIKNEKVNNEVSNTNKKVEETHVEPNKEVSSTQVKDKEEKKTDILNSGDIDIDDGREVIINVDHLTKDYGYGRGVFDVSIKVHKGECYGYLGPNGAGKSTTIRHIMGFSKPQQGSIKILGIESFGETEKFLGRVGYLPGEPAIPAGLNGWGFIKMMQEMRGDSNVSRLEYLLDLFKLDPKPNVKSMSLGEKRKLAVVTAFMNDPDVLVLDEPTSGLDPIMQQVFIKFIVEEKKRGKTILLSSHIFSEVEATCDKISIIKDGKHVSTFNADDLKNLDTMCYVIQFADLETFNLYVKKIKFNIISQNDKTLTVVIQFSRKKYKQFLDSIINYKVKTFKERPYTLQDYFMSFYKEEKTFGGLSGVVGNKK